MRAPLLPTLLVGLLVAAAVPWASAPTPVAAAPGAAGGGLAVTAVDVAGTPLVGTCYELWTDAGGGRRGTLVAETARCDQPAGSQARFGTPDGFLDGTATWTGLPPGSYVVHEVFPPALAGTSSTYALAADAAVSVTAEAVTRLELLHAMTGGFTIRVTDAAGQPLPGACFSVRTRDRLARTTTRCDALLDAGGGLIGDGRPDGILLFTGLTPSFGPTEYALAESRAPDGYAAVAERVLTALPDAAVEVRIRHETNGTGGLAVTAVDPAGTVLVAACFELWTDAGDGTRGELVADSRRCDIGSSSTFRDGEPDGFTNGTTAWTGLAPGGYVVHETFGPALPGGSATYELAADVAVKVRADAVAAAATVHRPTSGLVLRKVDAAGRPLPGACFRLSRRSGMTTTTIARCDGPTVPNTNLLGDGKADGLIIFTALTPTLTATTWTVAEVRAPEGYLPVADEQVVADPFTPTELTIRNGTGNGGGLAVLAMDEAGTSLVGSCYELWTDAGNGSRGELVAGSARCDLPASSRVGRGTPDGFVNGTTAWTSLKSGTYVVHETFPPALAGSAAIYETAPDTTVTIRADEVARLELAHRLQGGLTIHKTDGAGRPLPGACFSVTEANNRFANATVLCDRTVGAGSTLPADGVADGRLDFVGLTPSLRAKDYVVAEVRAPDGYGTVAEQRVTVDPATSTEVTIANSTARAAVAGGGGGRLVALELEISSSIDVRALNTFAVAGGTTTAKGRIPLDGDAGTDTWRGAGTLASTTASGTAACPSVHVEGEGTYDWVVRGTHAGPDVAASDITVDMDSGPLSEQPDTVAMDMCTGELLGGTMNTWESLFFDAYRSRFGGNGFRVDGWKLIDGGAAWSTGGLVAEATWTADCATAFLLDCTDHTVFRLYAVVGGTVAGATPDASPDPGGPIESIAPGGSSGPGVATAAPSPSGGIGPGGPVVECGLECDGSAPLPLIFGGLLVALAGAFLFYRFFLTNQIVKVEGPDLAGNANDVEISTLDFDKHDPNLLDLSKVEPIDTTFDKHDPNLLDLSKVEPLPDGSLAGSIDKLTDPSLAPGVELPGDVKLPGDLSSPTLDGDLPPPPRP